MRGLLLVLKANCIRQPNRQLPSSNHDPLKILITSVHPSSGYKFLTATMKYICNDSFTDVLRAVSVLWLYKMNWAAAHCLQPW